LAFSITELPAGGVLGYRPGRLMDAIVVIEAVSINLEKVKPRQAATAAMGELIVLGGHRPGADGCVLAGGLLPVDRSSNQAIPPSRSPFDCDLRVSLRSPFIAPCSPD